MYMHREGYYTWAFHFVAQLSSCFYIWCQYHEVAAYNLHPYLDLEETGILETSDFRFQGVVALFSCIFSEIDFSSNGNL